MANTDITVREAIREAVRILDSQPVPSVARHIYDPVTGQVKSLKEMRRAYKQEEDAVTPR